MYNHFFQRLLTQAAKPMQVRALGGGGTVNMPPQGSAEKAAEQSKALFNGMADGLTWPAWQRKLDAIDPSYAH